MIGGEPLTGEAADRHNAIAWLTMDDDDLVRCSASLGLPAELHPEHHLPGHAKATKKQKRDLREAADANAREHAGDEFVDEWIRANREE